MKVKVLYTETVVQRKVIDVETEIPLVEFTPDIIEDWHREDIQNEIEENGWDEQEVLETNYTVMS